MVAVEDVGGSMCGSRLPHSRPRKAWADLTDAAVPTGTSVLLSRNSGRLFDNKAGEAEPTDSQAVIVAVCAV